MRQATSVLSSLASLALATVACGATLTGSQPDIGWDGLQSFTVTEAQLLREPSWSPDGTQVAVVADTIVHPDNRGQVAVVTLQTGSVVQTDHTCSYFEPHWSPDGQRLLYSGCNGLSVADLPALSPAFEFEGYNGDWAPNGQGYAVFMQGDLLGPLPSSLFVADANGIAIREVFSSSLELAQFGGLSWSAAADQIAFSFGVIRQEPDHLSSLRRSVHVVDPSGAGLTTVGDLGRDNFDPSWSPDGRWLVYLSAEQYSVSGEWTVTFSRSDGSCLIPTLSSPGLTGVDWSPDGAALALTYANQLYVVDLAQAFGMAYSDLDVHCAD